MTYTKQILKVLEPVNYRGFVIYQGRLSFTARGNTFKTLKDAKDHIDAVIKKGSNAILNSLNK